MNIKFLGAAGTVTGSSYVITSESGQPLLIDMGMFQGPEEINQLNYLPYEYQMDQLSGAILTHAHLDHCGRLPMLTNFGFSGKIHMTQPTLDLAELVLFDSAKIAKLDDNPVLYDSTSVERTLSRCQTQKFNQPFELGDFEICFYPAGHLLGAASISLIDKSSTGRIRHLVFSGDLGNNPEILLRNLETIPSADLVVIESTYGDRLHASDDPAQALQTEINQIENQDSILLIPCFALERTQEVLHMIKHLKQDGLINKSTPVYLDSPMAQKATDIYRNHPQEFSSHLQSEFDQDDPFDFPGIEILYSHQQSQKLHSESGPMIIVAGGGMMTGGRIVGHAARFLKNPKNRIFFVGYQGEETLGREILEGVSSVTIDDRPVEIRANVSVTKALSAHADQGQLLDWLGAIKGTQKLFITHGEDTSRQALAEKVKNQFNLQDITLPQLNQEVEV